MIKDFVKKLREKLEDDVRILLFGSYARGTWLKDSDLDIIVISNRFRGLKLHERYILVRELLPDNVSVDLLLYTEEEFEKFKRKSIILQDALTYAIDVSDMCYDKV
ncbi:MAG: nucleotidyltransferase domain-containing protein [Crenarchaeota archaeon]|nr:nucleotidyltransferase domain-containing protein [Thermoproteota archaeon]